jgi:hypothetical protein
MENRAEYFQQAAILQESSYRIYAISVLEDYAGALHLLSQDSKAASIFGAMAEFAYNWSPLPPGDQPRQERLLADLYAWGKLNIQRRGAKGRQ